MVSYALHVLPWDAALLALALFGAWLAGLMVAMFIDIFRPRTDAVRKFLNLWS